MSGWVLFRPSGRLIATSTRVRLGRDWYVPIAGNDYSIDPTVIGRFVDVHAGLTAVTATCAALPVADHQRCWTTRRTITDAVHVATAGVLRTAFKQRTAAMRGPAAAAGAAVRVRALSDYDDLFHPKRPAGPVPARWFAAGYTAFTSWAAHIRSPHPLSSAGSND